MFFPLMRYTALATLICLAEAGTGGNTSYRASVAPLLQARPDFSKQLEGLKFSDTGNGTAVSYFRSPELAGQRVGPYEFVAEDAHGKKARVQFRTRQRYVNPYGVVVADVLDGEILAGGNFASATTVREELVGVTVAYAR